MRLAAGLPLLLLLLFPSRASGLQYRSGGEAPQEVRKWFGSLYALLDEARRLEDLLVRSAPSPRVRDARGLADGLAEMSDDYARVSGDAEGAGTVRASVKALRARLRNLQDQNLISPKTAETVYSLGKDSLYRWLLLMRQEALAAEGPKGRYPANAMIRFGDSAPAVAFIDLSGKLVVNGQAASPALRALIAAADGAPEAGGRFVVSERRIWARRRGAELFADLKGPSALLRIRWKEPGGSVNQQARFYFFMRALYEMGFAVGVQNGELTGTLSAPGIEDGSERFTAALRALDTSTALGPGLKALLRGSVRQDLRGRKIEELARIFAAEGRLPFLRPKGKAFLAALEEYRAKNAEREGLRARMNATLARYSLGEFPAGAAVGQRSIDLYYNRPVDAALARGELVYRKDKLAPNAKYDPVKATANRGASMNLRWRSPGRMLKPILDKAKTMGAAGVWIVQRAQWRASSSGWLTLYFLRDAGTGSVAFVRAEEGGRKGPHPLSLVKAWARLAAAGFIKPAGAKRAGRPAASGAPQSLVFGTVLNAGPAPLASRLTYSRDQAKLGDRVYLTPYVGAKDAKAVSRSRALVTTSGGVQAAVLAGAAGVPAVDVPGGVWSDAGLRLSVPVFGPVRGTAAGALLRYVEGTRVVTLRESDAIRVDPLRGAIEPLSAARQSVLVRLEDALRAYDRSGDINALALWTVGQLKAGGLDKSQKRVLAESLRDAMFERSKTGISKSHLKRVMSVIRGYY